MATTSYKGAISMGLLHIPVSLYAAAREEKISFNQLHSKCGHQIRQKKYCPVCEQEVTESDIVKGYEVDKDQYVQFTKDELDDLKSEKDRIIDIIQFIDYSEMHPVYFERPYHALPDQFGDRAFELLRTAMREQKKIAIGKCVIGQAETLIAIMPTNEGMLCETLYFEQEIRGIPRDYNHIEPSDVELQSAGQIIEAMTSPFDISDYHSEYMERIEKAIAAKADGNEIVHHAEEPLIVVSNTLDALTKTLDILQTKKRGSNKKKSAVV